MPPLCDCVSDEDAVDFLIASFGGCFLANEAQRALAGKVCWMRDSIIWLALM